MNVGIDFETRSLANLRQVGAYRYAQDPSTDAWCMAYKVYGVVSIWKMGDPYPFEGVDDDFTLSAWNAGFERNIWNEVMHKKYGWPFMPLERWRDTAAAAATLSLPRALENAAKVLLPDHLQKDMSDRGLAIRMSKPRKITDTGEVIWWDVPAKLEALYSYCKQDVVVESAIYDAVWPAFTEREQEVWRLDQRMNDHGLLLDLAAVRGAKDIAEEEERTLSADMRVATDGEVDAVTNTDALRLWVNSKGAITKTVNREWVEAHMNDEALRPCVRHALQIRYAGGKSSVAKLDKMLEVACEDGRAHGTTYYYGADTGRWAGRLIQPQNLPRGEIPIDPDDDLLWELLQGRRGDLIQALYGPPMTVVSAALRGMIVAPPGHDLIASDYSSIEAVVLAWLLGEERVLEIARTHGLFYEDMASTIYHVPIEEVTKAQRAHGKVGVLGCGYQMGAKTLVEYAASIGVTISLSAAQEIVDGYRARNQAIVSGWADLIAGAYEAVSNPGREVRVRRVSFKVDGWFLWMTLPSGRRLAYASPSIVVRDMPWSTPEKRDQRPVVQIWHVNSFTRQWSPRVLYGGLLAENATQAVARDVMVEGLFALDRHAAYTPNLTVHDEIVMEVPKGEGSVEEVQNLMTTLPEWAAGLPVKAKAWRGSRYRKD